MKKLSMLGLIGGAALLAAAPFSLQWSQEKVALSVDSAEARIGRPWTPLSVAGAPGEELVRGNAMSASYQAYCHARLEGLLDDPNLLSRCPAPTALNRCDDLNSIHRIAHRHGCMPHT